MSQKRQEYYKKQEKRIKEQLKNKELTSVQKKSLERELSGVERTLGKEPTTQKLKVTPAPHYVVTDPKKQQSYIVTEQELNKMKREQEKKIKTTDKKKVDYDYQKEKAMYEATKEVWPVSTWYEENIMTKIPSKNVAGKVVRGVARVPQGIVGTVEPVFTSPKWLPKLVKKYKAGSKRYGSKYMTEVTALGTIKTLTEPIKEEPVEFFVAGLATELTLAGGAKLSRSVKRKTSSKYIPLEKTGFDVTESHTIPTSLDDLTLLEKKRASKLAHSTLSKEVIPSKDIDVILKAKPEGASGWRRKETQFYSTNQYHNRIRVLFMVVIWV